MKIRVLTNIALVVLTILYPVGVYLGIQHIEPRYLVLALLIVFLLRFLLPMLQTPGARPQKQQWILMLMIIVFAVAIFISNSLGGLLLYPVIISLGLLASFAYTLAFPPSMVERLARLTEPNLSAQGVRYTRKVTIAWCLFFITNGTLAAATALHGDMEVWTLYNGCISYIMMGIFFAVEYLIRLRVKRQEHS